jgi:hypothetical protein
MPRRRYGKPIDLTQLRAVMSQAILDTKKLTDGPDPSPELVLKVAHALSQLAGSYERLVRGDDFDKRLRALEEASAHGPP